MKFVLGDWNEGDFGEARKHIAPAIEIYTNGLSFSSEHGGPAMVKESIESWRALAPDVRMELSQEIREKDRIAIEFRITAAHSGDIPELPAGGGAIDVEGTAFLTLSGGKVSDVRTVFESRRCFNSGYWRPAGHQRSAWNGAPPGRSRQARRRTRSPMCCSRSPR